MLPVELGFWQGRWGQVVARHLDCGVWESCRRTRALPPGDPQAVDGHGKLYEKPFGSTVERQLTDFAGRSGYLAWLHDTDGEFLYFIWSEDHGDLQVRDVEQPGSDGD